MKYKYLVIMGGIIIVAVGACVLGRQEGLKPEANPGGDFACDQPVATGAGMLKGEVGREETTCVWKGVPFAAPPVGDLRWRAPEPVSPWEGVREATRWGSACVQSRMMKFFHSIPVGMSEDCLYLNVWRPRKPGKFPVMVFFHGGAYFCGSGAVPLYFGDRLSANGELVVVTINYRLSALGFLAHEELAREDPNGSTGNYGTLDQIAALEWVRDNIAAFGGDPDKVTIFGQSAGGWSVCALLATPLARGLFQRAIIESGGCESLWPREKGYETGRWAAGELGCGEKDLACMRGKKAGMILKKLDPSPMKSLTGGGFRFLNHEDGHVFTGTPLAMIQSGDFNNVPLVAGNTLNEIPPAAFTMIFSRLGRVFTKGGSYEDMVREMFAEEAENVLRLYPVESFAGPDRASSALLSDRLFTCPIWNGVRAVAGRQPDTYYYRFDYHEMTFGNYTGAMHLAELPFVFGNFDRKPTSWFYRMMDDMTKPRELSRIIQGYWASLAYTGNPNAAGLPEWPAFRADDPRVQILDTEVRSESPGILEKCAFWSEYEKTHPSMLTGAPE